MGERWISKIVPHAGKEIEPRFSASAAGRS
jgi:hypothetical protein